MPSDLFNRLRAAREKDGARFWTKPWDLNLFVLRGNVVGTWDDVVLVATVDDCQREVLLRCAATADAWSGEWLNPTAKGGCIYTLNGTYPRGLELGIFKGRVALRQVAPFRYVRWPDRHRIPTVPELEALGSAAGFTDTVGTHVHNRISDKTPLNPATDDSEGCTVTLYQHEHAALIRLSQQQRERHGTGILTPTFAERAALGV